MDSAAFSYSETWWILHFWSIQDGDDEIVSRAEGMLQANFVSGQ
jgi:hypothetical protein